MNTSMSTSKYRLYRLPEKGWLAGVCAGMADYLGLDVRLVRFGWVLGLIFFSVPVIAAYAIMALVLKPRPAQLFGSEEEQALRRAVHLGPRGTLREAKGKIIDVDERLSRLEAAILSEELKLRREFRDIG
jgi:phage shock protein C